MFFEKIICILASLKNLKTCHNQRSWKEKNGLIEQENNNFNNQNSREGPWFDPSILLTNSK